MLVRSAASNCKRRRRDRESGISDISCLTLAWGLSRNLLSRADYQYREVHADQSQEWRLTQCPGCSHLSASKDHCNRNSVFYRDRGRKYVRGRRAFYIFLTRAEVGKI
jgi:hypothetical protein